MRRNRLYALAGVLSAVVVAVPAIAATVHSHAAPGKAAAKAGRRGPRGRRGARGATGPAGIAGPAGTAAGAAFLRTIVVSPERRHGGRQRRPARGGGGRDQRRRGERPVARLDRAGRLRPRARPQLTHPVPRRPRGLRPGRDDDRGRGAADAGGGRAAPRSAGSRSPTRNPAGGAEAIDTSGGLRDVTGDGQRHDRRDRGARERPDDADRRRHRLGDDVGVVQLRARARHAEHGVGRRRQLQRLRRRGLEPGGRAVRRDADRGERRDAAGRAAAPRPIRSTSSGRPRRCGSTPARWSGPAGSSSRPVTRSTSAARRSPASSRACREPRTAPTTGSRRYATASTDCS